MSDDLLKKPLSKYVVCRTCHRQSYHDGGAVIMAGYVDCCDECDDRLSNYHRYFLWWLTDCRPQGTFDAVGALAEAIKRDANGLFMDSYEETEEHLRARAFCTDALPLAWAEWLQWKKEQAK